MIQTTSAELPARSDAARLKITEYVVGVIAGDKIGRGRKQPPQRHPFSAANPSRGVDAATIRMIQRMLAVRWLNYSQIAREARVSRNLVEKVACGERLAVSTESAFVFQDLSERFLPKPIRCSGCHAVIQIVPCRACRARQAGEVTSDRHVLLLSTSLPR